MTSKKNFFNNFKPYLKNESWKKLEERAGEYRVIYENETEVKAPEETEKIPVSQLSHEQQDEGDIQQEAEILQQEPTLQETTLLEIETQPEELTLHESIEIEQTQNDITMSIHNNDLNDNDEPEQKEITLEKMETLRLDETATTIAEETETQNQNDLIFIKEKLQKIANEIENQLEHYSTNELLEQVIETQKDLKSEFQTKLKYDQHKDRMIDQLHKEVQDYKEDIVKSALLPLVRDLIMINDNIYKLVENYRAQDTELSADEILDHLEFVTKDIEDALFRQGIESFEYTGEKVDHTKQKIFKTVRSGDKSKERQVAGRMRKGYEWDNKIIRKELVNVYVYDEAWDVSKKIVNRRGR